jgi:hypothetical protein
MCTPASHKYFCLHIHVPITPLHHISDFPNASLPFITFRKVLMHLSFLLIVCLLGGFHALTSFPCTVLKSLLARPKNSSLWNNRAHLAPFHFLLSMVHIRLLHNKHFANHFLPHTSQGLLFVVMTMLARCLPKSLAKLHWSRGNFLASLKLARVNPSS